MESNNYEMVNLSVGLIIYYLVSIPDRSFFAYAAKLTRVRTNYKAIYIGTANIARLVVALFTTVVTA